jgi:hypothetical protein
MTRDRIPALHPGLFDRVLASYPEHARLILVKRRLRLDHRGQIESIQAELRHHLRSANHYISRFARLSAKFAMDDSFLG